MVTGRDRQTSGWRRFLERLPGGGNPVYTAALAMLAGNDVGTDPDPLIGACLERSDWPTRNVGVKLVVKFRRSAFYPRLWGMLRNPREAGIVRRNCAELVASLGPGEVPREGILALLEALGDPYWEVRAQSARAAGALLRPGENELAPAAERALVALCRGGRRRLGAERPADRRAIGERSFEVRAAIAEALGSLARKEEAFQLLEGLLADRNWLVRCQAAVAILEFGARCPPLFGRALAAVRDVDLLSDGAVSYPVLRERVEALLRMGEAGAEGMDADALRSRYLRIKEGWNRGG